MSAKTPTFIDLPNAAKLAGFSIRHFYRILKESKLKVVKLGRKDFLVLKDVDALIESREARHG